MVSKNEQEYRMQGTIELIERYLPLGKWNFRESSRYFDNKIYPIVIYDSQICRIEIFHHVIGRRSEKLIVVQYGSLEVPDKADSLRVNHKNNYHLYWHSIRFPLYFLDGLSPRKAYHEKDPIFIKEFKQSEVAREINYSAKKSLAMHAAIWESYGSRLFTLFDTSNTSLWRQYSTFIREYWKVLLSPNP